ncbi:MAG: glycoside hydrolase family 4, partial [Phycisphaerae bacterium]|nr:glycoside hydrolase family 4 [Phycisphaerae bacterium]
RDVLAGSDFVILSFADRSVLFRGIDCEIAAKHGIRMCSGDTIGPGGIFRTLREFPVIYEVCKDVHRLCPQAWVMNYINPTAAMGMGIRKYFPTLKSLALCDGPHMPKFKMRYAVRAGIVPSIEDYTGEVDKKFDMRVAGVNHFTWMIKAEYEGRDVMGKIAEWLRTAAATETVGDDTGAKALHNDRIGCELFRIFGCVPTCVPHTKEYVRFWQGLGHTAEPIPALAIWETEDRFKRHEEMWRQVDGFLDGAIPIDTYMTTFKPDHATDIVESIVGHLGKTFYLNTANCGAVTNMDEADYLELACSVDEHTITPHPVGKMPHPLRGLCTQVLDAHMTAVEAAISCRRDVLLRAMLIDPMVSSIADAEKIIDELLQAERDALPARWFQN